VQEPAASYDVDVTLTEEHLRRGLVELLRAQVAAMNLDNFIVRPRRRLVEKYARSEVWAALQEEDFGALARDVAGLPSELVDEDEEAKRFDLLMLRLYSAKRRPVETFA
jgi:type I restriction enzyme R subunit